MPNRIFYAGSYFRLLAWLRNLPRHQKMGLAVAADGLLVPLAIWIVTTISTQPELNLALNAPLFQVVLVAASCWLFLVAGLYRAVVRYIAARSLRLVAVAAIGSGGLFFSLLCWQLTSIYVGYSVAYTTLLLAFMISLRLLARGLLITNTTGAELEPAVIFGAGRAGSDLANELRRNSRFRPVAFLDNDVQKMGTVVQGAPVYSGSELLQVIERTRARHLFLALPRLPRDEKRKILETVAPISIRVRSVPRFEDLISGRSSIDALEEVAIEDILGRNPVPPDFSLLGEMLSHKKVLVTGAGGSIGSELCRQIVALKPEKLVLFEVSEYALYAMDRELSDASCLVIPVLGSVLDRRLLESVIHREAIEVVYHAAAYKHVPLVEANPSAGLRNNVEGTQNVLRASAAAGVKSFTLVSTDKAVKPTNIMGASKRLAELLVQAHAHQTSLTVCSMVRFGNVLGSSGSVFPLFREQIAKGGPVTVTHPKVTRYFMTIPEAAQLVLQASAMAEGGEVFVLDMGQPVEIMNLAKRLIQLSGKTFSERPNNPDEIEIRVTGLRPGEKLYEELLIGDNLLTSKHPRVMRALERYVPWHQLEPDLVELRTAWEDDDIDRLRSVLGRLVEGFPILPINQGQNEPAATTSLGFPN